MPDEEAQRLGCSVCSRPFTGTNRIHHCRMCGVAVCGEHSRARLPPAHLPADVLEAAGMPALQAVRACDACAAPVVTSTSEAPTTGGRVEVVGGNLGTDALLAAGRMVVRVAPELGASAAPGAVGATGPRQVRVLGLRVDVPHVRISFLMPPGTGSRAGTMVVDGRVTRVQLRYAAPELEGMERGGPVCSEGGVVTLRGANLSDAAGASAGLVRVELLSAHDGSGAVVAPAEVLRSPEPHYALQVRLPSGGGPATANTLRVTVNGVRCATELPFAYAPPQVLAVRCGREPLAPASAGSADSSAVRSGPAVDVVYVAGESFGDGRPGLEPVVEVCGERCAVAVVVLPHAKLCAALPRAVAAALASGARGRLTPADVVVSVAGLRSGNVPY